MKTKFSITLLLSFLIICLIFQAYTQVQHTVLDTNNKTVTIQPDPFFPLSAADKPALLIAVDSIDNPVLMSFAVDVFALSPKHESVLLGHFTAYPPNRGSRNLFNLRPALEKWNLKSANDLKIKLVLKPQSTKSRLKLFISEIKWVALTK